MGDRGDFSREFVLDRPMIERVRAMNCKTALDVGCGEGRFCRMLQACGVRTIGIDPTEPLLRRARDLDPQGDYRLGRAEDLEFPDAAFELVVSYLTLIDMPDIGTATREMARVLQPGGKLLIANLSSLCTALVGSGWTTNANGEPCFGVDRYFDERADWVGWRGIEIQTWHRPLSRYLSLLLDAGLQLRHFSEPTPYGGNETKAESYRRIPYFVIMEWEKPAP